MLADGRCPIAGLQLETRAPPFGGMEGSEFSAMVATDGRRIPICPAGADGAAGGIAGFAVASPLYIEHDWAGSLQMFRSSAAAFTAEDARLLWILTLLAENQMARIRSLQQLMHLAYTDFLTGLRTRGYFEQALEQAVHGSFRHSAPCGLVLVDLDNFKAVNDTYGHPAGDSVLRQFASTLGHEMREVDTVARFGGDEFALILPDTGEDGVRLVLDRLRVSLQNTRFRLPD